MTSTNELLNERGKTHGPWDVQSATALRIKRAMWSTLIPAKVSDSQIEALDMIAAKISRILTGDPNCVDHWADIAGYATLAANELSGQVAGVTTTAMQGVKTMDHGAATALPVLKGKVRCVIAPNGLDITVGNTYDIAKGHADPDWIFIYNDLNKVGSYKAAYFVQA